jgi:hypothetical protein
MRTDRQTDIPKLTVAFRNFANVPKTDLTFSHETSVRIIRMNCSVGKTLRTAARHLLHKLYALGGV